MYSKKKHRNIHKNISGEIFRKHIYGINLIGNNLNADLTSIYTDNILDIGYARMLINNGC